MAQTITIDLTPDGRRIFQRPYLYFSQGDVGQDFVINLNSRFGLDIPAGAVVKIEATKPSGFGFSETGVLSDGTATFTTAAIMTDEAGHFPVELSITASGEVLGTANFNFMVEPDPHPEGTTDGQAEEVIPELTQLVERVEDAASSVLDRQTVTNTLPAGSQASYSFDEETNTQTFGIPQGEAGAGSAGVVANAYSASSTYVVGDYVIHNSNLYRCTTAITTAEAFTSAHWTRVVLGDDVSDLKSDFNDIGERLPNGTNLFDGNFDESGYIVSGVDTPSDNYKRTSKYYPIVGDNTGNFYSYVSVTSDVFSFIFYDADKTFLANKNANNAQTKQNTLPDGAKYFRVYTKVAWSGNVTLSLSYVNSYIPYASQFFLYDKLVAENNLSQDLQDKINDVQFISLAAEDLLGSQVINIFDGTFPNSGYIDSDESDASSSSYKRTDYIPVDSSNSTLYVLRTAQPYILVCYFYDSSKNAVGSRTQIFNENTDALATSLSIPSTASYIRMYTHATNYSGNLMLSYTPQSSYVTYGEHYLLKNKTVSEDNLDDALKVKINSILKLTGKTIAFMGDSIIGNFYDATGVCAILAEKTGATVINCAFGGSRLAYEYSAYGDATPGASGYIDGATDAEKNQVDQYRYWNTLSGVGLANAIVSGTWTAQETAIASMSSGLDYFASRLTSIKGIDWSGVDFIMWEYGTNDFMTRVKLTDTADTANLFAFDNAFRHVVETILTEFPNIRIIPVTPIYRWYQSGGLFTEDSNTHTESDYTGVQTKLTDFVDMVQDVSKEYQLPCIDDYYTLGANKFTRLAYFNSTDGTHPNAQGRQRIAEHITSQLIALI